jgi:hypothetical protein
MWWANNWNSHGVFKLNFDFLAGSHVVEVFGGEKCCDGNMNIRFSRNSAQFKGWNIANLK